jgi:large subunit ribosomal protein L10
MKKKSDKEKDLQHLRETFEKGPAMFVAGFEKLTVAQDYELRKTVRGAGGEYEVVKNNLAAKASEGLPSQDLFGNLKGMTSVAYTSSDPVALAKALTDYAKTNPAFTFKAGFVEGRVVEVKSIQEIASLPSKEELISKMMWLINSSAQRLAVCLNGVARNLAVVVDQAGKEGKFSS